MSSDTATRVVLYPADIPAHFESHTPLGGDYATAIRYCRQVLPADGDWLLTRERTGQWVLHEVDPVHEFDSWLVDGFWDGEDPFGLNPDPFAS